MEEDPDELCKSISTFCSLEQMMIFGRPLWMSYSIEDTLDIAQLKLLGGKESDLKYNPLVDSTICSFILGRSKPDEDGPFWCKNDDHKNNISA